MRMTTPITINDSNLTSTTATYLTSEWSSGSDYAVGDLAHSLTTERVYEALIASTSADPKDPATSPLDGSDNPYWLDIGPTNPRAMFDQQNFTQTTASGSLEVVITPNKRVNTASFFNMSGANTLNIEVTSVLGGGVLFNQDYELSQPSGVNLWEYLYGEWKDVRNVTANGWFPWNDVVITATWTGADIGVGNAVYGREFLIGEVAEGLTINPRDFSLFEQEESGEFDYIPRESTLDISGRVRVDKSTVDPLVNELASVKSPRVWVVSDEYSSTIIYGVNTSFPIKLSVADEAQMIDFKITGLI